MATFRLLLIAALLTFFPISFAHACQGPWMEDWLFFSEIPPEAQPVDIAAEVVLKTGTRKKNPATVDGVIVKVRHVLRGDIKEGDTIKLAFMVSSCGPWHSAGEKGIIVARTTGLKDKKGRTVFQPYLHRRDTDKHVSLAPLPDWYAVHSALSGGLAFPFHPGRATKK